ncbi:hypothetical protein ACH5RR_040980 [Cinchona calisaya]|uniref:Transposase n=1 Tax=Cinchona calisaya TaxID=153742 RepID=A0ABD2XTS2_9GENT
MDNAAYNDTLISILKHHLKLLDAQLCDGEFSHVRCGAHILNLIVKSGLEVIEGHILMIHECVKYARNSEERKTKFPEFIARVSCNEKKRSNRILQQDGTQPTSGYDITTLFSVSH